LLEEVSRRFAPMAVAVRPEGDAFVAELVREDGTILWPNYAYGASELLAKQEELFDEETKAAYPAVRVVPPSLTSSRPLT
jgi:hypothetical protein